MAILLYGQPIADSIHKTTAERVQRLKSLGVSPAMAVLLVGNDKPSETYVRKKGEAAERAGIAFRLHRLPSSANISAIIKKIGEIQEDKYLSGLIIQLPLPRPENTNAALAAIDPKKDIDCLTAENLGKLILNESFVEPPTPAAIMAITREYCPDIIGKNITIVGVGPLVGKPLSVMMMNARASVTTCNSKTANLADKCRSADILVSAVGKKRIINADMVKPGAVVIDAGVSFEGDKLYGDVDAKGIQAVARAVTPTPGGVGPVTIAMLLANVVACAEENKLS